MLLLFPACSWQGGELRRAPCTNHVRQSRNVTSVPCAERVQRKRVSSPGEAPPAHEQAKVRHRKRPPLAGQLQKWEIEWQDLTV